MSNRTYQHRRRARGGRGALPLPRDDTRHVPGASHCALGTYGFGRVKVGKLSRDTATAWKQHYREKEKKLWCLLRRLVGRDVFFYSL